MRYTDDMSWGRPIEAFVKATNNVAYRGGGSLLDAGARGVQATYNSLADAVDETARAVGFVGEHDRRLEHDLKLLPQAFAGSPGVLMRTGATPVGRTNSYPRGVREFPISELNPIHNVPRNGAPPNHIENIAKQIKKDGFDVTKPVSGTKLPNGQVMVSGGHHRLAAMKILRERMIPTRVYDGVTDPVRTARYLGIGKTTGKYTDAYLPELTEVQKTEVNAYLRDWRTANPEQVTHVFEYK